VSDFNAPIIAEFRANAGKVGGRWEGRDLLLLTTTGRKSGRRHTTPTVYTRDATACSFTRRKAARPSIRTGSATSSSIRT